jgi:cytochrome b subunit of formate dehydrogenase
MVIYNNTMKTIDWINKIIGVILMISGIILMIKFWINIRDYSSFISIAISLLFPAVLFGMGAHLVFSINTMGGSKWEIK